MSWWQFLRRTIRPSSSQWYVTRFARSTYASHTPLRPLTRVSVQTGMPWIVSEQLDAASDRFAEAPLLPARDTREGSRNHDLGR